jgi:hypothetical protein
MNDDRTLPNRQIDARIAAWLGDTRDTDGWWCSRDDSKWRHEDGGPRLYSSDWNEIKRIVSAMRERGCVLGINQSADGYGARFRRDWETGAISGDRLSSISYDPDMARAVCLAALQALDQMGSGI